MVRVLAVEDDEVSLELLRSFLERRGYQVMVASTGEQALDLLHQADLLVLDVMLPGMSGREVAQVAREQDPDLPILMLTAMNQVHDRVAGFESGADDYLVKPYDLRELDARLKSLLRRSGFRDRLERGDLTICPDTREVFLGDTLLRLSKLEFDLLLTLARHPGRTFSRDRLIELVWGGDYEGLERTVDVRIVDLRKKLGGRDYIQTVRGVGYRFRAD
ncbi:two-component system alkaline phosphatase synthesis response regulator PhoP [Deinobacterium chartae]|uniref:Two-component system alkaline phosphatase synthesis response regulator PhoP n=1 Tax=Deinobacterium chartae TaxID=521158 RepID=A0A841I014_9DEIO|nr:response regulator transcription factor [Deinobacterium chartae]MBB6098533.1 two-component system alkaline phosphatase synthesis response regulator PhoP [Deinobacterium chartae]